MTDLLDPVAVYQTDHDLLILLNEKVSGLTAAVKEKTSDHEIRIRWLESRGWMLAGAAVAVSVMINYTLEIVKLIPHA